MNQSEPAVRRFFMGRIVGRRPARSMTRWSGSGVIRSAEPRTANGSTNETLEHELDKLVRVVRHLQDAHAADIPSRRGDLDCCAVGSPVDVGVQPVLEPLPVIFTSPAAA